VDLGGSKEPLDEGAHRRNLANTIEQSMCDGDAAFLSNYFEHLLDVLLSACRHDNHIVHDVAVRAVLHGSRSSQTDRQTDRPRYSVCNNRLHLRGTAMQPSNVQHHLNKFFSDCRYMP